MGNGKRCTSTLARASDVQLTEMPHCKVKHTLVGRDAETPVDLDGMIRFTSSSIYTCSMSVKSSLRRCTTLQIQHSFRNAPSSLPWLCPDNLPMIMPHTTSHHFCARRRVSAQGMRRKYDARLGPRENTVPNVRASGTDEPRLRHEHAEPPGRITSRPPDVTRCGKRHSGVCARPSLPREPSRCAHTWRRSPGRALPAAMFRAAPIEPDETPRRSAGCSAPELRKSPIRPSGAGQRWRPSLPDASASATRTLPPTRAASSHIATKVKARTYGTRRAPRHREHRRMHTRGSPSAGGRRAPPCAPPAPGVTVPHASSRTNCTVRQCRRWWGAERPPGRRHRNHPGAKNMGSSMRRSSRHVGALVGFDQALPEDAAVCRHPQHARQHGVHARPYIPIAASGGQPRPSASGCPCAPAPQRPPHVAAVSDHGERQPKPWSARGVFCGSPMAATTPPES